MMRGYFVQKGKHLRIATSTTTGCKSQTSESHKSKFSPEHDIHNYLFINLRSSNLPLRKYQTKKPFIPVLNYMPPSEFVF
jgi:hypothetical protein